jgi:hypothetical protein
VWGWSTGSGGAGRGLKLSFSYTKNKLFMNPIALIVKSQDERYSIYAFPDALHALSVSNDCFQRVLFDTNFLGFYDWLRISSGEVIGLRVKLNDSDNRRNAALIQMFFSASILIEDVNYIFFGDRRDFIEVLSDDTDFCDFSVYRSSQSIGISFNQPAENYPVNAAMNEKYDEPIASQSRRKTY